MEDLEFDLEPDEHRYTFQGSEVPATTRILELASKPLDGIPAKVLEAARQRGNAVHRAIELYMKNDLDRRSLTREVKLRFDRWCRFMDFHRVEPVTLPVANYVPTFMGGVLCEIPLVHPLWKFGVTPDVGICVVEGDLAVVEIKVRSTHNDATALQMASQKETVNHFFEKHGYKVAERWSVRLTSDDRPDVRRYKSTADWPCFLAFMNVHNWRKVHKVA